MLFRKQLADLDVAVQDASAMNVQCCAEELHGNHQSLFFGKAANFTTLVKQIATFGPLKDHVDSLALIEALCVRERAARGGNNQHYVTEDCNRNA